MNGLAELALQVPDKVLMLLKLMEQDAKPTPTPFKCVEAINQPDDYQKVVQNMLIEKKKTVDRLRFHCDHIVRDRWWKWTLLHPGLGEQYIHPTRSVPSIHPFLPSI